MILEGKKVLVLGAARSGVAAAKVLKQAGADVVVTDSASEEKLINDLKELQDIGVPLMSGGHPSDLLNMGFDLLVKNPGIPPSIPFLQQIREVGIPIISEIELAYQVNKGQMIGITGSNGKTTTTTWLGEMLQADRPKVRVAGNIGIPLSLEAANCDEDDWLVVELSSFQLNDVIDFRVRSAAILNLSEAHLDWHGGFDEYYKAKSNLMRQQQSQDYAILNADNQPSLSMAEFTKGKVWTFSRRSVVEQGAYLDGEVIRLVLPELGIAEELVAVSDLGIGYAHNVENAMAATLLALSVGAKLENIRPVLHSFKGLAHRFQIVAEKQGRLFINDSKATNPGASEIAMTLPGVPVVLIAGGLERHIDLMPFAKQIKKYCRGVALIGQTKERLARDLTAIGFTNFRLAADMAEAVPLAFELSQAGDTILLSTGCASWDMYSNYDVRGDDFIANVAKIPE